MRGFKNIVNETIAAVTRMNIKVKVKLNHIFENSNTGEVKVKPYGFKIVKKYDVSS